MSQKVQDDGTLGSFRQCIAPASGYVNALFITVLLLGCFCLGMSGPGY